MDGKKRIVFVCLGNICRSPMAESVFTYIAAARGELGRYVIASAGTSGEEAGNPVHRGTVSKLTSCGIPVVPHRAVQLTGDDCRRFDYVVCMERANVRAVHHIFGGRSHGAAVCRLLDFTDNPRDIADPWFTGDFDTTYRDVWEGCTAMAEKLSSVNV